MIYLLYVLCFLPRDAIVHTVVVYAVIVCLSVTSGCSTETAKRSITQTVPHDSPGL